MINMLDRPSGIYQYTTVNVPAGVGVSFTPNASNTPVIWLVQGDCNINGTLYVHGHAPYEGGTNSSGGTSGPGGFAGGVGASPAAGGRGPGGAPAGGSAANASYATLGDISLGSPCGATYGNAFIMPLLGGSGGGGATCGTGGGGGGGALLIAASETIYLNGSVFANGGAAAAVSGCSGGAGSGGAVRLIASRITGNGYINVQGGVAGLTANVLAGYGRARFDTYQNDFSGLIVGASVNGVFSQGFQPIIIPAPGQGVQLAIQSVAGNAVPTNPGGVLATPDLIISAQQQNPVSVVVNCTNVSLNSEITVVVHPANGPDVQAVGLNSSGNTASSTATVSLNMPRGGGIIYAKAVTGISGATASASKDSKALSYAETGLTAEGERFAKVETKAVLGGKSETTLITESGKRFPLK